jgi:hypothetical protein
MLASCGAVLAQDALYELSFGYDPDTDQEGGGETTFGSQDALLGAVSTSGLTGIDPTYDGEPVEITLDLRGAEIDVIIKPVTDETDPSFGLIRAIVEIDGEEADVFDADTQDEAIEESVTFIRNAIPDLTSTLVATTATDPVAGNPSSLQTRMISADFQIGTAVGNSPDFSSAGAGGAKPQAVFGLGLNYGNFSADGVEVSYAELPFSYAIPLDDPRYAILFEAPLTFVDINGAESITASLGTGIRLPMTDDWSLTPTVRVGLSASDDFAVEGYLYGASLVSNYNFTLGNFGITLGNQMSHLKSLPLDANDYDLQNTVIKNGVGVSGDTKWEMFGLPVTWEGSVVNTRFFGDELFIENFTDVAVSLGTSNSDNGFQLDSLRLGVTYTFGDEGMSGTELNFGYKF